MAKLALARGDETKLSEGIWVEHELGYRFKVRRLPNRDYTEMRRKLCKPHIQKIRRGRIDIAVMTKITQECVARTILVDWDEVEDDEGKAIPFTPDKALEILVDPAFEDIYNFVVEEATDYSSFVAKALEAGAKNFDEPSGGISGGPHTAKS